MDLFGKSRLFFLLVFSASFVNCGFLDLLNYDHTKDLSLSRNGWNDLKFPRNDKIRFFLYPNYGLLEYEEEIIVDDPTTLRNYDPNLPLILIIHGFMQNYQSKHPQNLKNAYLNVKFPANVIVVDWQNIAQPQYGYALNLALGYPLAIKYVNSFAKQISDFILFLIHKEVVPDPSFVHVIGFSLGGQIAGVTGAKVKNETGGAKIGRITGLDPAGLNYHLKLNKDVKLDRSDAKFVDVVHTAIVSYGYILPVGHIDYYPNGGGPIQPNCKVPLDRKRDLPGLPGSCSHARAWDYFTDTVYNGNVFACKDVTYGGFKSSKVCNRPIKFGQYAPKRARGVFFFDAVIND